MFDTMTITKAVGGFCGALLVFLLGAWLADAIYGPAAVHGEGEHAGAYVIEVASAEGGAEAVEEGPDFMEVFATADAAAGEGVFRKCASCHTVTGEDKTGPHLNGVVGRAPASVAGFTYKGDFSVVGAEWTPEALNTFLLNPKADVAGTAMNFAGLSKIQDRADLIAYLQSTGG